MTRCSSVRAAKFSWELRRSWTVLCTCFQNNVKEKVDLCHESVQRPVFFPLNIPLALAAFTLLETLWIAAAILTGQRWYQQLGSTLQRNHATRLSTTYRQEYGKNCFGCLYPSTFKTLRVEYNYIYIIQISDSGRTKPNIAGGKFTSRYKWKITDVCNPLQAKLYYKDIDSFFCKKKKKVE